MKLVVTDGAYPVSVGWGCRITLAPLFFKLLFWGMHAVAQHELKSMVHFLR